MPRLLRAWTDPRSDPTSDHYSLSDQSLTLSEPQFLSLCDGANDATPHRVVIEMNRARTW